MADKKVKHVYAGRAECGCIVGVVTDNPSQPKDTAKYVAEFIADGMTIERMELEAWRKLPFGCSHEDSARGDAGEVGK